jgi:hypothetical protein
MWDGFCASPQDLSHVTKGVTNERALSFVRAVFFKALQTNHVQSSAPVAAAAASAVVGSISGTVGAPASAPAVPAARADAQQPPSVRGGGFGLDAAVAQKIASKYDADSEAKLICWIGAVTALAPAAQQTFGDWLKNGSDFAA